jgi:hypothetical protein
LNEQPWFPVWVVWVLLLWLALHMLYDLSISRDLRARRKPGEPPPGKLGGFLRYREIMQENTRRYESGDLMARLVMYTDWMVAGGFVLLLVYRMATR